MTRIFLFAFALVVAALPAKAETPPQGLFLLSNYIWPEEVFGRFVSLRIEGDVVTVEFSSHVGLNYDECSVTGDCLFAIDAATAQIEVTDGQLVLSGVDVLPDLPIDTRPTGQAHVQYVAPVMGLIDRADITNMPNGFTLTQGETSYDFVSTTPETRQALIAYPVALNVSLRSIGGCDIRALAPLFTRDDLTEPEATLRDALLGMAVMWQLDTERARIDPVLGDGEIDEENIPIENQLRMTLALPRFLSSLNAEAEPALIDEAWEAFGEGAFSNDRAQFDAAVARYGDTLLPLVAFQQHLNAASFDGDPAGFCADPTLGFLAAQ